MDTQVNSTLPIIQTERLIINALAPTDIKLFYEHRTHPDILRYQGEFPRSEDDVQQLLEAQAKFRLAP
jgi:RimJ/RimL family protein N-acetyltransferase